MERRLQIIAILEKLNTPIKGTELAKQLNISRQTLVQDIALLRKDGYKITSTIQGYMLEQPTTQKKDILGIIHTREQLKKELDILVSHHVEIVDVFIVHPVYGEIRGELNIRTPKDVKNFLEKRDKSPIPLFSEVTGGLHYHTLVAEETEYISAAKKALIAAGFEVVQ